MEILLLSGSYVFGGGYLDHYENTIRKFLTGVKEIVFVPYAADRSRWDQYTGKVKDRFAQIDIDVIGIHEESINNNLKDDHKAIFIGGGNTFRLLYQLQSLDLVTKIKDAVMNKGLKYIGSSAGSNIACHTICTINDMPIIYPPKGFVALNLLPFQLNPHYMDPDPSSTHMGETRDERIREFHEANNTPVVGLREGAYLSIDKEFIESKKLYLGGNNGAKFFFAGKAPIDIKTSGEIRFVAGGIE